MALVLDASVVLKLLVQEPGTAEAVALLDRNETRIAPDWLAMEIAGALWNKVKYSKLLEVHAENSLEEFPRFLHRLYPSRPLLLQAFRLSIRLHHAVYDCIYLALAVEEKATLITADKEFFGVTCKSDLAAHVELLAW